MESAEEIGREDGGTGHHADTSGVQWVSYEINPLPAAKSLFSFVPEELQEHIGGPRFIRASNWNGFSTESERLVLQHAFTGAVADQARYQQYGT